MTTRKARRDVVATGCFALTVGAVWTSADTNTAPPYDKNRYGTPYTQRREPFVEIKTEHDACRILSAFCIFGPDEHARSWQDAADGWLIETCEGSIRVHVEADHLDVTNTTTRDAWRVRLQPSQ